MNVFEAAAFARLCVETMNAKADKPKYAKQPPSRGCVLKQKRRENGKAFSLQPSSGGCVLKL